VFQDVLQGTAHLYIAILINEPLLSKFVHEKNHARSDCANHFGERLFIDFHSDRLRGSPVAEFCHQKKWRGQPLSPSASNLRLVAQNDIQQ
jgi:hypothetical protein